MPSPVRLFTKWTLFGGLGHHTQVVFKPRIIGLFWVGPMIDPGPLWMRQKQYMV